MTIISVPAWSQQQEKEASFIKRAYHNTTARYNGYYHAKLRINQALRQLKSTVQFNYNEVLPLYPYIDAQETSNIKADMKNVSKKTSKVIKLHPISKWIDDCYLMLGKAYFLQKDYENAKKSFVYITTKYKQEKPKEARYLSKGQKFKRNVNDWFKKKNLKHQPVYFEASMWLIHSYIALEQFEKAKTIINLMQSKSHFPDRLRGDIHTLITHLRLKKSELTQATVSLKEAIKYTEERERKAHLTFILAQLYQKLGHNERAIEAFNNVLQLHPPYEMEFYAKINIAKTYEEGGTLSMHSIKNQLKQLAQDDKNTEYLDQIYYYLARLHLKKRDTSQAVHYLKKSVNKSVNNNRQKALSYLELADLHFKNKKYESAKYYYDSTLTTLPKDYKDYKTIQRRGKILDKLIKNILVVERQDSLLRLARLPKEKRNAIIQRKVEQKREQLAQQKQSQSTATQAGISSQKNQRQGYNVGGNQKWYFYNNRAKSQGKQTFQAQWGKRKLQDHWRRSVQSSSFQQSGKTDSSNQQPATVSKEQFLNPIPLKKKEKKKAQQKIIEALYNMGVIYREQLQNYQKAIQTFTQLNERFKNHEYKLSSYFHLYLLHKELNNYSQAGHYKNLIFNQYPDSKIAKNLKNPSRQKKPKKQHREALKLYERAYQYYENNDYKRTIMLCNRSDSLLSPNPIKPKFKFLEALSYGQQRDYASYKTALEKIVKKHKNTSIHQRAQRLLKAMDKKDVSEILKKTQDTNKTIYAYSPREKHRCLIILSPDVKNSNQINIALSKLNNKKFQSWDLEVSNLMLTTKKNMIMIKGLPNAKKGKKYLRQLKKYPGFTNKINKKKYNLILISRSNFKLFYDHKNITDYRTFYKQNYVSK